MLSWFRRRRPAPPPPDPPLDLPGADPAARAAEVEALRVAVAESARRLHVIQYQIQVLRLRHPQKGPPPP